MTRPATWPSWGQARPSRVTLRLPLMIPSETPGPWLLRLPHTGHFANGYCGRLLEPHAAVKVPDNLAEFHAESVCDVIGLS
jgi:hypothetical protein